MHGPQVHAAVDGGRGDVDAGVALQLDGQPRVVRVQVGDAGGDVPERHDRELRRAQRLQIRLAVTSSWSSAAWRRLRRTARRKASAPCTRKASHSFSARNGREYSSVTSTACGSWRSCGR